MFIYVAGPMRGVPEFNFPAFNVTTESLRKLGHTVFNPAERDAKSGFKTEGMTGNENLVERGFDLRAALYDDLAFITREADAICVLDGWENSSGARAEVATAHALGLKVGPRRAFALRGTFRENYAIKTILKPSGELPSTDGFVLPTENFRPARPALREGTIVRSTEGFVKALDDEGIHLGVSVKGETRATSSSGEVRSVSRTGGEKGVKLERFDLIPPDALGQVARHYGVGAAKYEANQYRRGYEYSKSYGAMQRHLNQWWNGEDNDEETGSSHLAAAAWHCLTLMTFMKEHPDFDDRIKN